MRWLRIAPLALAAVSLEGANKEHEQIQRDIATVSEDVKRLQRLLEDQALQTRTLIQQSINTSTQSNTALAGMEVKFIERLQLYEREVKASVAGMGAKVDAMADEFRRVKEDVADMNGKFSRLQTELTDVKTACSTIRTAPPVEPPKTPESTPQGAPTPQAAAATTPGVPDGVSAQGLLDSAERDRIAGKFDLSEKEFNDYLKYFPKTEAACMAQYRLGEIQMAKQDLVSALVAFDNVLERYDTECKYRPAAQFMKGRAFEKGGQKSQAVKEYRKVVEDHPGTDWATRAKNALKDLNFSVTPPQKKRSR
ncbi:MAG: tetratricopeptide repeat protein [Bryobacteraceae bacterium]